MARKLDSTGDTPSCTVVRRRGPDDESLNQVVRRVNGKSGISDPWECAILELGDGRTVHEVVEALYNEELRKGAWLVDIGLWKSFFDRSVVEAIGELARRGLICLEPSHEERRNDMPATTRKKRERSKARKAGAQRDVESGNGRPIGINHPRKRVEVTNGVAMAPQNDRRLVTEQQDHAGSRGVVRPHGAIHPGTRQEPVSNEESAAEPYRTGQQGAENTSQVVATPRHSNGADDPVPQQLPCYRSAFTAEVPHVLRRLGQGVVGGVNNLWKRTAGSMRR